MKLTTKILLCFTAFTLLCCSCSSSNNLNTGTTASLINSSSEASTQSAFADTSSESSVKAESASSEAASSAPASSKPTSSKPVSSKPISSMPTPSSNASSAVQSKPIDTTIKYVAFTFDDGPHYKHTKNVTDIFKQYGGSCTFFVIGNRINSTTGSVLKYAVENGCEIGIHAYTHRYYYNNCSDEIYRQELSKTADAIHNYLPNYNITLMRPVGGKITQQRIDGCQYSVITWNVDSQDWRYKNSSASSATDSIRKNIMKDVKNGSIILMHEIYNNSYSALCTVLGEMYSQGYRFVTVSELIGKDNLQPAKKYWHA